MSPHLFDATGRPLRDPRGKNPHDMFGRPLTAADVQRRSQPLTVGYYEDHHEELAREVNRTRAKDLNRGALLFMLLALISTFAAWRSYDAGSDSQKGLQRASIALRANSYQSALASCLSGSELRVLIARGFDSLRRTAVADAARVAPRADVVRFFQITQPPIDDFLTQAAYDGGRKYHVTTPLGKVTRAVENEVLALSISRCRARTDDQFRGLERERQQSP